MYVFLPGHAAAVWQDDPADTLPVRPTLPPVRTLWARRAFHAPGGRCIGVRLRGDALLQVCVVNGSRRRWLAAERVQSERQAQAWARAGFRP